MAPNRCDPLDGWDEDVRDQLLRGRDFRVVSIAFEGEFIPDLELLLFGDPFMPVADFRSLLTSDLLLPAVLLLKLFPVFFILISA